MGGLPALRFSSLVFSFPQPHATHPRTKLLLAGMRRLSLPAGGFRALLAGAQRVEHFLRVRNRFSLYTIFIVAAITCLYLLSDGFHRNRLAWRISDDDTIPADGIIPLRYPYTELTYSSEEPGLCAERYGTLYIREFSSSATNHCNNETQTSLTCFTHRAHDSRTDSFCVGAPAEIDATARTVGMNCPLRPWSDEDRARHAAELKRFPSYWYNTGPRTIFDQYINLDSVQTHSPTADRMAILVKREETIDNLWHTLMQIMSVWLSLDVLRATEDPTTHRPIFTHRDFATTQAIIIDDLDDGPFMDMWDMFGERPTLRLKELATESIDTSRVLIPLPGGSNPFWQGDWEDLPCDDSALLKAFSRRVLDFYGIPASASSPAQLTLIFIDRREQRLLDNQESLFAALLAKYPHINAKLVDFAQLPMQEQLRTVREADILAGVHGAGLTHGMFLPESPSSAVVEILPPTLKHKGFRNMAKLLGHRYFGAHGTEQDYEGKSGDWHRDKVFIEEERFLALLGEAIERASDADVSRR